MDIDPDQVQIECMVDKDGREVKRVKPILIKKEITTDYATQVPFELGPGKDVFLFTDEERVPYADCPYEPRIEEETNDDEALQQIIKGLLQVADGYEALKDLLPTIPVTDVAKIVQVAPTPYLQPMSKAAIQALQTLGEEDLINQACLVEFQKRCLSSGSYEEIWYWQRSSIQSPSQKNKTWRDPVSDIKERKNQG